MSSGPDWNFLFFIVYSQIFIIIGLRVLFIDYRTFLTSIFNKDKDKMSPKFAFKRSTCIVIYRHFASKVKSQDSPKMSWSSHGMNLESVFPVLFIWSLSFKFNNSQSQSYLRRKFLHILSYSVLQLSQEGWILKFLRSLNWLKVSRCLETFSLSNCRRTFYMLLLCCTFQKLFDYLIKVIEQDPKIQKGSFPWAK